MYLTFLREVWILGNIPYFSLGLAVSFQKCVCVCVCVCERERERERERFSKFQVFSCQFEFSWQNLQVFSVTDAWRRRKLGVLQQSNAPSWGSSCSALVTVYTTSPKVFRKQIIREPLPPIQNSGPFSSTHFFSSVLFVFCHEFQQSVYVVCVCVCVCAPVCVSLSSLAELSPSDS